jgi:hypothetical protein
MRISSAVPFGYRRIAKQDIHLSNGAMIPRGTQILGSAMASMTSPQFWGEDVDLYIPVSPAPPYQANTGELFDVLCHTCPLECFMGSIKEKPSE